MSIEEPGLVDEIQSEIAVSALTQEAGEPELEYNERRDHSLLSSPLPLIEEIEIMQSRRQILQAMLSTACTALTLSPYTALPSESWERLEKAFVNPSGVDTQSLHILSAITQEYWKLSGSTSADIVSGVSGHFATITQILKDELDKIMSP